MKSFKRYIAIFIYILNVHNSILHASVRKHSLLNYEFISAKNPLVDVCTDNMQDSPEQTFPQQSLPQGNIVYKEQIKKALLKDDAAAIQRLSQKESIDFNQPIYDSDGATIVHKAVYNNATNILTFLIENKLPTKSIDATMQSTKKNPLKKSMNFSQAVSNTLISIKDTTISYTNNAIKIIHPDKKIDLNAQDNNGYTALHVAMILNKLNAIKLLAHAKEINFNLQDRDGYTPLHIGMLHTQGPILREFISSAQINKATIDFNLADNNGWTPLHTAHFLQRDNVVQKLLLAHDADNSITNKNGMLPYQIHPDYNKKKADNRELEFRYARRYHDEKF